ncbi:MAG TPA: choice-of-anchor tandem repeat GloVer-containing protein [Verrucomicrobiae bacterium]
MFAVNTDGTDFTNLHSFNGSDGANPHAGLILSGDTLYGTAENGGVSGEGTVFRLNTDGSGFTNLYKFTGGSDGSVPSAGLILLGNTLYGTAGYGGSSSNGVVFAVNTDGTGFTDLYNFTNGSDGANPVAGLILSGNTLYGTASQGGTIRPSPIISFGTVFSLFIQPQLIIIPSGTNVILSWPTNATGFTLQSNTNFVSPAGWNAVSPAPVVVNGQNAVTNPISGTQQFFRLSQ